MFEPVAEPGSPMRLLLLSLLTCLLAFSSMIAGSSPPKHANRGRAPAREVALTFDDLPIAGDSAVPQPGSQLARAQLVTQRILAALRAERAPAIGFVNENRVRVPRETQARTSLLKDWLDAGMLLGNHTYSHPDFNTTSLPDYENDIIRGEQITRPLMRAKGIERFYFRHPFTHTGPTLEAKRALEQFLQSHGYTIAPFTIEHSDYIFNVAWLRARQRQDQPVAEKVRLAYLDYLGTMFDYIEQRSRDLLGYEVRQILLTHANELNAECLPEILSRLRSRGYSFISLDRALEDRAYRTRDEFVGRYGPSWLHRWAAGMGSKLTNRDEPDPPKFVMDLYQPN